MTADCRRGSDTYHQVADDNLHNLGLEAGAAVEDLLEHPDEDVAEGSANEGTVGGHLGDARGKVVAVLVAVLGEPRGEELLETGETTGGEHLGAEGVGLELLDVGLLGTLLAEAVTGMVSCRKERIADSLDEKLREMRPDRWDKMVRTAR